MGLPDLLMLVMRVLPDTVWGSGSTAMLDIVQRVTRRCYLLLFPCEFIQPDAKLCQILFNVSLEDFTFCFPCEFIQPDAKLCKFAL